MVYLQSFHVRKKIESHHMSEMKDVDPFKNTTYLALKYYFGVCHDLSVSCKSRSVGT
jgi:hypothetical protein